MGSYYEILRPVSNNDLNKADPGIAAALKELPSGGYVDASMLGTRGRDALEWACARSIAQKTKVNGRILEFDSVRFWLSQLNPTRMKNIPPSKGTKQTYAEALNAFNEWLRGKELPVKRKVRRKGGNVAEDARKSFSDVEDLLRFCEDSDHGIRTARRAVRQYLAESAGPGGSSATVMVRSSAIRSYFAVHDVQVDVRVNRNRGAAGDVREDSAMGLPELYKLMVFGGMDAMMRAVTMIKFQAGLDSSTLADRFNFEAYSQIVRHFGIEDYDAWDLDRCPVPIRIIRVKTGMQHTTFIDRDAVSYLQDYLRWRESKHKRHDGTGPLFVTQRGTPVRPAWISFNFSRAAVNAGIQRRITHRSFKVRAHEVRDLLKSTLMVSGCAQYVADHVIGHAPRDSYEKQAILYPENLRKEYSKASGRLNIFARIERLLVMPDITTGNPDAESGDGPGGPETGAKDGRYKTLEAQQREMQAALQKMTGTVSDILRIMLLNNGRMDVPDDLLRGFAKPDDGGSSGSSSSSSDPDRSEP